MHGVALGRLSCARSLPRTAFNKPCRLSYASASRGHRIDLHDGGVIRRGERHRRWKPWRLGKGSQAPRIARRIRRHHREAPGLSSARQTSRLEGKCADEPPRRSGRIGSNYDCSESRGWASKPGRDRWRFAERRPPSVQSYREPVGRAPSDRLPPYPCSSPSFTRVG